MIYGILVIYQCFLRIDLILGNPSPYESNFNNFVHLCWRIINNSTNAFILSKIHLFLQNGWQYIKIVKITFIDWNNSTIQSINTILKSENNTLLRTLSSSQDIRINKTSNTINSLCVYTILTYWPSLSFLVTFCH